MFHSSVGVETELLQKKHVESYKSLVQVQFPPQLKQNGDVVK